MSIMAALPRQATQKGTVGDYSSPLLISLTVHAHREIDNMNARMLNDIFYRFKAEEPRVSGVFQAKQTIVSHAGSDNLDTEKCKFHPIAFFFPGPNMIPDPPPGQRPYSARSP